MVNKSLSELCSGLPLTPMPENRGRTPNIAHAAKRNVSLTNAEKEV